MYKVLRSYSKKAERKHELTRSNQANSYGYSANGYNTGLYGRGVDENIYGDEQQQQVAIDGRERNEWNVGVGGAEGRGKAFSESSSYEAREHFERKVKRVKKTRAERDSTRKSKKNKVSFMIFFHFMPIFLLHISHSHLSLFLR